MNSTQKQDTPAFTVDIWTDIVCPFCYIGKRKFDRALAMFEHSDEVQVRYRSFQLDTSTPRLSNDTIAQITMRRRGLSSVEEAAPILARIEALAREEGLDYRLGSARPVNSLDAHRLVHLADAEGRGAAMLERLYIAYAIDNEVVSDHAVLVRLAREVGLDPANASVILASDAYTDAVTTDQALAARYNVRGVPSFLVDGRYLMNTESSAGFLESLRSAWREH